MELSVALEKPCYFPGEVVKCLIKVRRLAESAALPTGLAGESDALQLLFECSGTERIDPSWIGHLYKPEVTAIKDNKRLVRSIFSTGQVPLLGPDDNQGLSVAREFVVRCRLPNKLPPSYRGNAVRFVYQVVVQGKLQLQGPTATDAQQKQQVQPQQAQQQVVTCQAQSSLVVWPMAERSSSSMIDRRASLPQQQPHGHQAGTAAIAAVGPAAAVAADGLQETELIDYKLGMQVAKLRWEEVLLNPDGTRTLLMAHHPTAQLYPALTSRATMGSQLLAAQMCSLDSLLLDDQQAAAAAAAGGAVSGTDDSEGAVGGPLRHLTAAQRASMAVRTFNLRAGDHPLVRVMLQPPLDGLLQPGGTFGLLLDFRESQGVQATSNSQQPVCLQVVALLESEEIVLAPYTHNRSSDSAAMRKLHAEQQEVTAHLLTSQFVFSIPLTASPTFKTPMVSHRWVLRFELTLGKPKPKGRPGEMVTEQLLWSLPLVVFPPPLQSIASM